MVKTTTKEQTLALFLSLRDHAVLMTCLFSYGCSMNFSFQCRLRVSKKFQKFPEHVLRNICKLSLSSVRNCMLPHKPSQALRSVGMAISLLQQQSKICLEALIRQGFLCLICSSNKQTYFYLDISLVPSANCVWAISFN